MNHLPMPHPLQKKLKFAFWLLALLDVTALISGFYILHFAVKPLLIPVLILCLFFTDSPVTGKNLLTAGLIFSWMGDIFLLFENKHALFFIFGLVSFLTTHIFYIFYFLRIKSSGISILKKQPLVIVLVLAYGVTLVWLLFPYLNDLKLPVIVYAAVICSMLLSSLHIVLKVNKKAAGYYMSGATAFVVSDSLLAINKFYQPFACADTFIMLTYCAAQYFIIRGYIEQK